MSAKTLDKVPVLQQIPADNRGKRIGILIVAYNAVTTLAQVFRRIPQDVWENVEEVVVFDDDSQDDTYELAMGYKFTSKIKHLNVFKNPQNLGYGGNQKLGYEYFISKGFDVVVLLHGDGQYAPEILSHLYHPIIAGEADAVFGSRMMKDYGGPMKGGMPLYKYVGNRILTFFENAALGMDLTEFHSGYRAYSVAALKQIDFSKMTNDFHFDTEIIIKLNHQNFRIKEVPIPTYYGNEICYVNGMKYARDVFKSVFRYKQTIQSVRRNSEFSEYFINYPIKQSKFSSHYYFRQLVGKGFKVLDVGCGEGFFASTIAQDNKVVGIDFLESPSQNSAFEQYIWADLENGLQDALGSLEGQRFDKVLLPDVLEHLRFPERLLFDCMGVLKPEGLLLVSVPNVANITVRLSLLLGRWNYTERGILDKTHYRFYTHATSRRLLEANGYEVIKRMTTIMPIELVLGLPSSNPLMVLLNRVLALATALMPGLLGYQCVFVARRRQS
ncbi:MAG: glycosyltransferase [Oscillatoriophycideae cyanobacterium NC_groundwater_1537_Pr4_S-0.65um_50_18]|nr:glycosyltransferase [Oscillatoriophycideae cyanobacterium NC_groundwater_1537_Pr4_S-0.65um_50_18]